MEWAALVALAARLCLLSIGIHARKIPIPLPTEVTRCLPLLLMSTGMA